MPILNSEQEIFYRHTSLVSTQKNSEQNKGKLQGSVPAGI